MRGADGNRFQQGTVLLAADDFERQKAGEPHIFREVSQLWANQFSDQCWQKRMGKTKGTEREGNYVFRLLLMLRHDSPVRPVHLFCVQRAGHRRRLVILIGGTGEGIFYALIFHLYSTGIGNEKVKRAVEWTAKSLPANLPEGGCYMSFSNNFLWGMLKSRYLNVPFLSSSYTL